MPARISAIALLDQLAVLKGIANSSERKELAMALLKKQIFTSTVKRKLVIIPVV